MAATTDKGTVDAAVNDVTTALGNATISDKADEKSAADAAASAAEGRRLYIGNLAYASTEAELKEFFKGYTIDSVSIPKNPRTEKAVGYAFVDLATSTEATRAIEELSGKEILERKVSVQLAHKPEADKEGANGEGSGGEGSRRRSSGRGRGARGRGRGGRAARGGRAGATEGNEATTETAAAEAAPAATEVQPLRDITNKNTTDRRPTQKTGAHAQRDRKERGPPADGIPSKTKVMVANLPYDLTEEKLKELFAPYEPSTAKIALRPIPRFMIKKLQARNEARKGRGFGFVTLASEEMQQKAVAEMNDKEIEGRVIAVKVAIDSPDKVDEGMDAPDGEEKTNGTEAAAEETTEATPAAPAAATAAA